MEDVLEVYARPEDPRFPLVCLDEATKQLVKETRQPQAAQPGAPATYDYEYERNGVGTLFMMCAPVIGWREVKVTQRKQAVDYAHCLRELAEVHFAHAERIILVQDNLNTHGPAALYETFAAGRARELAERFEFHYTPKHGSWLNVAEIELSVLARQCLSRRIPDVERLKEEVSHWSQARNNQAKQVNWRFNCADARIKLKKLYPSIDD